MDGLRRLVAIFWTNWAWLDKTSAVLWKFENHLSSRDYCNLVAIMQETCTSRDNVNKLGSYPSEFVCPEEERQQHAKEAFIKLKKMC
jgi:hypothetical protein